MKKVSNLLSLNGAVSLNSTCWGWGREDRGRNKGLQKLLNTEENRSNKPLIEMRACWNRCHSDLSTALCSLGQTRAQNLMQEAPEAWRLMGQNGTRYLGPFHFFRFPLWHISTARNRRKQSAQYTPLKGGEAWGTVGWCENSPTKSTQQTCTPSVRENSVHAAGIVNDAAFSLIHQNYYKNEIKYHEPILKNNNRIT